MHTLASENTDIPNLDEFQLTIFPARFFLWPQVISSHACADQYSADSRGPLCISPVFSMPLPPVSPTNYSCLGPFKLLCLLNSVRSLGSIWVPHSCSAAQKLPPDNKVGRPQGLLRFASLLSVITFLCLSVISYIAWYSNCLRQQRRRRWHPTPVLLPGKSHGWRSLVGCNPWGC